MFFALEKNRYMNKNMKCILLDYGRHITEQKAILEEQTKFYKGLYTKDKNISFNLTRGPEEKVLTEEQRLHCDAPLQQDELFDVIMTLRNGKCPGGDGLTVEFYRVFYKQLVVHLYAMYQFAYKNSTLPLSTRWGVISLHPKKGKGHQIHPKHAPFNPTECGLQDIGQGSGQPTARGVTIPDLERSEWLHQGTQDLYKHLQVSGYYRIHQAEKHSSHNYVRGHGEVFPSD